MQHLFDSKINGTVKVKKYLWETSVWVGGYQQSGPLVKVVWQKALENVTEIPKNVLILGLGCGIAAKLISKKFPNALIMGVEIDPVMIEAGKKYFDLRKIKNLKIICADAKIFLKKNKQKFDLILVDIYIGEKQVLLNNLKFYKKKNGTILLNELKDNKNKILIF